MLLQYSHLHFTFTLDAHKCSISTPELTLGENCDFFLETIDSIVNGLLGHCHGPRFSHARILNHGCTRPHPIPFELPSNR